MEDVVDAGIWKVVDDVEDKDEEVVLATTL